MLPCRQNNTGPREATTAELNGKPLPVTGQCPGDDRWTRFVQQYGHPAEGERYSLPLNPAGPYAPLAGLLIDLSTLCDCTVWQRWLLKQLQHIGLHTQYRCVFKVWELDYLDDVQRGLRPLDEAFRHFLQAIGLNSGQIDEVATASLRRQREAENSTRAFPGVNETLAAMVTAGLQLGIVANADRTNAELAEQLNRMGLSDYLSSAATSLELGHTTRCPHSHRAIIQRMALPAESLAFLGHDRQSLAAAQTAGLRTIALHYEPDALAHAYMDRITTLSELGSEPERGGLRGPSAAYRRALQQVQHP